MTENNSPEEQPVFELIQQIKDGVLNPETIPKDLRQRCVEVLLGEGCTVASMAQILKKNEKTIRRDLEDVRERNAIAPDINLAKKIVGEMIMYVRIHRDHLMKLSRTKESSVAERSQAEFYAFKVEIELITRLQTLGYLPTQPQAVVGDIYHHANGPELNASFSDLKAMITDIVSTAKETNILTPELQGEAESLRSKIEKAELSSQVSNFLEKHPKKEG